MFGFVLFAQSNLQAEKALGNLASMDASAQFPKPIGGHMFTVGELREQIAWEPKNVLIVNLILAAVMAGLAFWSRRSPLPAILIATATYAVVTVTNALIQPASIAQGLVLKIIVIGLLVRGIKAALAMRTVNA